MAPLTVPPVKRWVDLEGAVTRELADLRSEFDRHVGARFAVVGTQQPPHQIKIRIKSGSTKAISVEEAAACGLRPRPAVSQSLATYHTVVDECFEQLEKAIVQPFPPLSCWKRCLPGSAPAGAAMPSRQQFTGQRATHPNMTENGHVPQDPPVVDAKQRLRERGVLRVRLHRAMGLRAADRNGKSDPYVVAHLAGHKKRTKTVKKTLDPTFGEVLEFEGQLSELLRGPLVLKLYDYDAIGFDDPLGEVRSIGRCPLGAALWALPS